MGIAGSGYATWIALCSVMRYPRGSTMLFCRRHGDNCVGLRMHEKCERAETTRYEWYSPKRSKPSMTSK